MAKPSKPSKPSPKAKPSKAKPKAKATKATKAKPKAKPAKPAKPTRKAASGARKAKSVPPASSKAKRGPVRNRRLPPAELQRRLDIARDAALKPSLKRRWEQAMERMRDHLSEATGIECVLKTAAPPKAAKGTPWALVARFGAFDGRLTWRTAYYGLRDTEEDERIESLIGSRRLCRIAAKYQGPEVRGGDRIIEREFTLSEIAPWPFCISRAVERTDVDSEESMVARYPTTEVKALYVWIALEESRGVSITMAA